MYKMMVVDDEQFIYEGLKHLANWEDYGIEIASHALNGIDALEMIKDTDIDILVTDIKMPKMDGLELIRNIRLLNLDTKIIVLSGYNEFEYVKESIKYGIENYILKPVNEEELLSTLKNTITKTENNNSKNRIYENNIAILRENILYRWVSGSISREELLQRAEVLDIDLHEKNEYRVGVLRILSPSAFEGNEALVLDEIRKISHSLMGNADSVTFYGLKQDIVFLYWGNGGEMATAKIKEAAQRTISIINARFHLNCFITLGNIVHSHKEVHHSYETALEMQGYFLIFKPNHVIDSVEIAAKQQSFQHSEVKIDFEEFKNLVLMRKTEEVAAFIDSLYDNLSRTEGITPHYLQNTAIALLSYLITFLKTIKIDAEFMYNNFRKINIGKINTIDELTDSIKNICTDMIELLVLKDNKTSPLIHSVLAYFNDNYAREISLKTLSQVFNCNTNYLGQVFKTETGEFFTDYLNKFRIEKACQLLIEENWKASEVSGMVGYINQNYFYKAFKKYTGLSPSEYKSYIKTAQYKPN